MSIERELKGRVYQLEKENRELLKENLKLIRMAAGYQKDVQRLHRK